MNFNESWCNALFIKPAGGTFEFRSQVNAR